MYSAYKDNYSNSIANLLILTDGNTDQPIPIDFIQDTAITKICFFIINRV